MTWTTNQIEASNYYAAMLAATKDPQAAYYSAWYRLSVKGLPDTAPPVVPPVVTAVANGAILTITYRGTVIYSDTPSVMPVIKQVSPTRVDFVTPGYCYFGMLTLPGSTTNVDPEYPVCADTRMGPAINTLSGPWGSISFASADADVSICQTHAAPGGTYPERRYLTFSSLAAGARTVTLSLCVDAEPLTGFTSAFVAANPVKLKWTDRRPILVSATDPNKALDTTLVVLANSCIAACRGLPGGGQGVIYWALDNQANDARKYLGCPELVNQLRPAGDTLETLAAVHKAAGVPWGVCIRPWTFSIARGVFTQILGDTSCLSAKLAYLNSLGATLVYIDSCPTETSAWLASLQAKYPNILLIPEMPNAGIQNAAQTAYGAVLRECAAGAFNPLPQLYPSAFQTLLHPAGLTDAQWAFVKASKGAFVPLVEAWDTVAMSHLPL